MKLTYFQLEQQLKNKLAPIYVISSDETHLKNDLLRQIRQATKQADITERKRFSPENQQDWDSLYSELQLSSLFSQKTLIEIDLRQAKLTKHATNLLLTYCQNPNPDHTVVIDLNKADSKITKSAWYQAANKVGATIPVWPIPQDQIPRWIRERAKRYQMSIAPQAIQLLADYVEGNLTAAAQTLEKLYLLKLEQTIDVDTLEKILTNECRHTVFDYADALLSRQPKRAMNILSALEEDNIEPTLVLWSITRELRTIINILKGYQAGESYETLFQKHHVFARRQPLLKRFLSTTSEKSCSKLLSEAANIDKIIKGIQPGNPWQALRIYSLRLV